MKIECLKYLRTQSNWGFKEFALIREKMANGKKVRSRRSATSKCLMEKWKHLIVEKLIFCSESF